MLQSFKGINQMDRIKRIPERAKFHVCKPCALICAWIANSFLYNELKGPKSWFSDSATNQISMHLSSFQTWEVVSCIPRLLRKKAMHGAYNCFSCFELGVTFLACDWAKNALVILQFHSFTLTYLHQSSYTNNIVGVFFGKKTVFRFLAKNLLFGQTFESQTLDGQPRALKMQIFA